MELHCKDKTQPRKYENKKIGDLNSASSIAKIFDSDNKEVKLKYHDPSSNYLESTIYYYISIYEPKMKYKNSLNH